MKSHRFFGLVIVLLVSAGCGPGQQTAPSGEVYEGKHVSEWGDAVKGTDRDARLEAAKVLVKLGKEGHSGKEAIQALHQAVDDEDPAVRGWAAVALVYAAKGTLFPIGQVAGPKLKEAAESSDEELRVEAKQLLEHMAPPAAGPPGNRRGGGDGPPQEKKPSPDEGKG